jgi:hypothetical protein
MFAIQYAASLATGLHSMLLKLDARYELWAINCVCWTQLKHKLINCNLIKFNFSSCMMKTLTREAEMNKWIYDCS